MDIRITTADDLEQVKKLWAYCFENHEPFYSWYFREYFQSENTLGIFQGEKLLSSLQLIPYDIFLRGRVLPTSYIVGVASFPEARSGGLVGELMVETFRELKRRDHTITLLMPFKGQFYYPYQFLFCYHHYKYEIKLEDLKPVAESYGDFVELQGTQNIADLDEVYRQFTANKHGFIVRNPQKWRLLLEEHQGEKGFGYLLIKDGRAEGYILYYLKDNKLTVREMAYSNWPAQKSLFRFMYNHRSQVENLEWNAPLDDSTFYYLGDPKKGISLFPFLTARIVDVKKFLESIFYAKEIQTGLVLKIEDRWAPWNNQSFKISLGEGQALVEETESPWDVLMDIGALTQLVFGRVEVKTLIYQNRLKAADMEKAATLGKLFPPCNNYINEYY
ncbi:MAG: GNAT family N-acetyltransferase [Clostridia bacterium]|nr:GNAT family N-acetyltransferase [Clostridia bacterium]